MTSHQAPCVYKINRRDFADVVQLLNLLPCLQPLSTPLLNIILQFALLDYAAEVSLSLYDARLQLASASHCYQLQYQFDPLLLTKSAVKEEQLDYLYKSLHSNVWILERVNFPQRCRKWVLGQIDKDFTTRQDLTFVMSRKAIHRSAINLDGYYDPTMVWLANRDRVCSGNSQSRAA